MGGAILAIGQRDKEEVAIAPSAAQSAAYRGLGESPRLPALGIEK